LRAAPFTLLEAPLGALRYASKIVVVLDECLKYGIRRLADELALFHGSLARISHQSA